MRQIVNTVTTHVCSITSCQQPQIQQLTRWQLTAIQTSSQLWHTFKVSSLRWR